MAKVKITLVVEKEIDVLLDQLCKEEHRKRSVVVELALRLYAQRGKRENPVVPPQPD